MFFEKVKRNLRISTDAFDEDIQDLIVAAKKDMELVGIKKLDEADPLISRAIILYCKGHFYMYNKDSEKYLQSYDLLKQHLSMAGDYNNE